ncbi:MAG TPA: glycosyltransferase family 4 protein [Candidatus Hydrogenedentes bacterium]|nr:glycosyltransferase family 4 protein [Candidatus Hydrogenedentota bacterium]
MKILIPTVDYPPIEGGIATVALQLARQLTAMGHEVIVVAPNVQNERPVDDALNTAKVIRFDGYEWGWFRFFPLFRKTWPLIKETDLILAINISYGGIIARLAKLIYKKRYVVFAYAYEFLKFKHTPILRGLLRNVYRCAETTVAISRFTRRNLEDFGVPHDHISVILPGANLPTPIHEDAIQKIRTRFGLGDSKIILAVGRFIPRKGHITLVTALPEICEHCPNTHLVMVGRGPCREECLEKAKAMGIEGQVHCPGYLPEADLTALYQTCDVFALPNDEDEHGQVEGFGLVFAEAHAFGKPVVAGLSGGVTDAVLDGETGLLLKPGEPHALAQAIVSLLNDPHRARHMGEAGRKRVQTELNWQEFTKRVLASIETPLLFTS